jgi:hypothetical protein
MYREAIFGTARRFDSLFNHAALVDYHLSGASPAYATVTITRSGSNLPKVVIGTGVVFTDSSGNNWHPIKATLFSEGSTMVKVNLIQEEITTLSSLSKPYRDSTGAYVADINITSGSTKINTLSSSCSFTLNGQTWNSVKSLAYSGPTDRHFILVYEPSTKTHYIQFGDGTNGMIPSTNYDILNFQYSQTAGANGNVDAGSINSSTLSGDYTISNEDPAGGGTDGEDFYDIKRRVPLSVRTLGVAVTKQDIVDLALQNPGVGQATLDCDYERRLTLYVSPVNGGSSNDSLCSEVRTSIINNAPIVTWLEVKSVKEVYINLTMEVTGRKSYRSQNIKTDILNALKAAYPSTGPIGGSVRISDIYALIDNLDSVDYLLISSFYLHPVFKVLYGTNYPELSSFAIESVEGSKDYILEFISSTQYMVIPKANESTNGQSSSTSTSGYHVFSGTVGTALRINYPEGTAFSINVKSGNYSNGDRFQFTVSEPNHNYEATGFNIPVFKEDYLALTINEIV